MPQFAQDFESGYDQRRANTWGDNALADALGGDEHPVRPDTAIEVDEVQMKTAGGDPEQAYAQNQVGNKAARIGSAARGVAEWYTAAKMRGG